MNLGNASRWLAWAAVVAAPVAAFDGQAEPPEAHGLDPVRLQAWMDSVLRQGGKTCLLLRHDVVVAEGYAPDFDRHKPHYSASMAKALVGGMGVVLALEDGVLRPEQLARDFVPSWRGDPLKSKITIAHLATHTSGLEDAEQDDLPHNQLTGWKGEFWSQRRNPIAIARDEAPVIFEPGTSYAYSNPGMAMLGACLAAAWAEAGAPDLRTQLATRVFGPLGVPDKEWSISYGKAYETDGLTVHATWGGGGFSAEAVARVGLLLLHRGEWEGRQLVSAEAIRRATDDAGLPAAPDGRRSGLGFWLNSDRNMNSVPNDAVMGSGAGNQTLVVIPSLDLVLVRNGSNIVPEGHWAGVEQVLLQPLMAALTDPGTPTSLALRGVRWAPAETFTRAAIGSDNWPLTWCADGTQLTCYGDGWGFEPRVERKLSLGLARLRGGPDEFRAENLRSTSAERVGDGAQGAKTSGLVAIGGRLLMAVRNTGNAQWVWSDDGGRNWTWGGKFATSFGCPAILNVGRAHAGAPDDYVYLYSQDTASAYEPADGIVLARAPVADATDPTAYQYFAGLDDDVPRFSADVAARQPVIVRRAGCERLDVVWQRDLGRYLMTVSYGHRGGWGIYDAPQPWGPWTMVWTTPDWGLGETHGYRLPLAWWGPAPEAFRLVFSGRGENDAFCVRRGELVR